MYLFKEYGLPCLPKRGKIEFATILAGLACLATPGLAASMSFEEAFQQALEQAGYASAEENAEVAARARLMAASALPNPSAFVEHESLDGAIGKIDETAVGVSTSLDFLWKRAARIESADRRSRMVTYQLEDNRRRLSHEIAMTFVSYGNNSAELEALQSSQAALAQAHAIAESLVSNGDIPPSNLRRIELAVEQLNLELVEVESRKAGLLARFSALVGQEDAKPIGKIEPDTLAFDSSGEAIATAHRQRADLRALEAYAQWRKAEVEKVQAEGRPDASLDLAYKRNSDDQSGAFIGLSVELPIFGQSRAQTAMALTEQRGADLQVTQAKRVVAGEVAAAFKRWQRLSTMQKERADVQMEKRQNEAYLQSAIAAFEAGESTLIEYLDALNTELESRRSQLVFVHQLNLATLQLATLTGAKISFNTESLSE